MDYKEECERCKEILRPMAATIYGHLYQADNSHYRDEIDQVRCRAHNAVLAASCICEVLNQLYGDD